MILKQYYLDCLSQASYLVGDEASGIAAIVDPRRDVYEYLEETRDLGLTIRHVILTHFHADFVSGHLELRELTGATIHLGARGRAEFPFSPLADGDVLDLEGARIQALETPGHTPESISLLVFESGASRPRAVLTGDTLFIGDVGRPDLMVSQGFTALDLAGQLYDSLHGKLLTLPDETLLYPGHGAGSMCGKNLSTETVSTIGEQRRLNYALQPMSKDAFAAMVTADQPVAPGYFAHDAMLNRQRRQTLTETLARALTPLSLDQVLEHGQAGTQILDTREPEAFAARHLAGSLNIGLGGDYAVWAGTLLAGQTPIVLIAEPGREEEGAVRLGRIGFDQVMGFLAGGPRSLEARPEASRTVTRETALTLADRLRRPHPPLVLDVRSRRERDLKRIPGSRHVPLGDLPSRLDEVPADRAVVVHCAAGYRSSIGASILRRAGRTDVTDLEGGLKAWEEAQLRVETPAPAP